MSERIVSIHKINIEAMLGRIGIEMEKKLSRKNMLSLKLMQGYIDGWREAEALMRKEMAKELLEEEYE